MYICSDQSAYNTLIIRWYLVRNSRGRPCGYGMVCDCFRADGPASMWIFKNGHKICV